MTRRFNPEDEVTGTKDTGERFTGRVVKGFETTVYPLNGDPELYTDYLVDTGDGEVIAGDEDLEPKGRR